MKITVIGASQGIGLELLNIALEANNEVTALVRNPDKLKITNSKLNIVEGNILDMESVNAVTAGQDAICVCIGIPPTRKPLNLFSQGTANVIAAMGQQQNQKLIAVTGIGSGDSKGHGGFFYDRVLNPLLLSTIYDDKNRQEAIIKTSNVEWLIVRPGFLTNGPRTGKYRVIDDITGVTAGKISRLDVADFILKQISTPTYFGKTPLLTY
jgi:putative NADH-flavin reductase